jgi:hypothetical protein
MTLVGYKRVRELLNPFSLMGNAAPLFNPVKP